MKLTLTLDYTIGEGWLAPWVDGIRQGKAIASRCSRCRHAQFPPLRICPNCHIGSDGWTHLDGRATIQFRTTGTDGDFALARFDGADGSALVRADKLPRSASRGRLRPIPDGPPVMSLGPESPT